MNGRLVGVADMFSCPASSPALTRLTFTAGDGTEYEFLDVLHDGQPLENFFQDVGAGACVIFTTNSRGKVFKTFDGSALTFISDSEIKDYSGSDGIGVTQWPNLSGFMFTADATRYRIDNSLVS